MSSIAFTSLVRELFSGSYSIRAFVCALQSSDKQAQQLCPDRERLRHAADTGSSSAFQDEGSTVSGPTTSKHIFTEPGGSVKKH